MTTHYACAMMRLKIGSDEAGPIDLLIERLTAEIAEMTAESERPCNQRLTAEMARRYPKVEGRNAAQPEAESRDGPRNQRLTAEMARATRKSRTSPDG